MAFNATLMIPFFISIFYKTFKPRPIDASVVNIADNFKVQTRVPNFNDVKLGS